MLKGDEKLKGEKLKGNEAWIVKLTFSIRNSIHLSDYLI